MYAAGKIPGSFFRREGRPSTDAILTCRLIDRPLRPTFIKGLRNEVQVVITVLALNPDHQYDVLAINAAERVDPDLRPAVLGPDRWRPRVADRRPVGCVPELLRHRALRLRHGRRRPRRRRRRRHHDGRGRVHRVRPGTWSRTRASRLRPRRSSPRASRRPRRSSRPCARRRPSSPRKAAKPVQEFPRLPRLPGRRSTPRSRPHAGATLAEALTIADKQEREDKLDEIKAEHEGGPRRGKFEGREKELSAAFRSVQKKLVRQRILEDKVRIDGRGLRGHPRAVRRGRGAAAGARLGAVRARRDPDHGCHHAEHAPDGAAARHAVAGDAQALHAQLQLPAVLHR